jgi:hypothetical protein
MYEFKEYPKYIASVNGRDVIANDAAEETILKDKYFPNKEIAKDEKKSDLDSSDKEKMSESGSQTVLTPPVATQTAPIIAAKGKK